MWLGPSACKVDLPGALTAKEAHTGSFAVKTLPDLLATNSFDGIVSCPSSPKLNLGNRQPRSHHRCGVRESRCSHLVCDSTKTTYSVPAIGRLLGRILSRHNAASTISPCAGLSHPLILSSICSRDSQAYEQTLQPALAIERLLLRPQTSTSVSTNSEEQGCADRVMARKGL